MDDDSDYDVKEDELENQEIEDGILEKISDDQTDEIQSQSTISETTTIEDSYINDLSSEENESDKLYEKEYDNICGEQDDEDNINIHEKKEKNKNKKLSILNESSTIVNTKENNNLFDEDIIDQEKNYKKKKEKKSDKKKKGKRKNLDLASDKWKKIVEPDEALKELLTKKDNLIRYSDIPERYYFNYENRKKKLTKKILLIESKWIINKLKEKYPHYFTLKNFEKIIEETYDNVYDHIKPSDFLSDNFLIKKCILTLKLLIEHKYEIPFIYFHKSFLIFPPFNLNILWDIFELDKIWYKIYVKIHKLKKNLNLLSLQNCTIHPSIFTLLEKYNEIYYEDINIYYYYLKNKITDLYTPTHPQAGNDNENGNANGNDNNINLEPDENNILCIQNGETQDVGNSYDDSKEYLKDDLFGEDLIEETEKINEKNEKKNEKNEKKNEKKNDQANAEQIDYAEKNISGLQFLKFVKKNKFNIWDKYLLTVDEFYENISYIFDIIKNEKICTLNDDNEYGNTFSYDNHGRRHDKKRHDYKYKLEKDSHNILQNFKYDCSKIKNIVTNIPEIYGNNLNIEFQADEWCKSLFPKDVANKDIFKTLICYYSKILASHPCIKYIFRFYFLKYASITTITTTEGEAHIDTSNPDYLSFRLFRFPVHLLLNHINEKQFLNNSQSNINDIGKKHTTRESNWDVKDKINLEEKNNTINDISNKNIDNNNNNPLYNHDPCYIHNYNVDHFNTKLDESEIGIKLKKNELEKYYNLHKYKHIYLDILKNKENKLLNLIIHPILPNEDIPWKNEKFKEREQLKKKKKKKIYIFQNSNNPSKYKRELDVKAYFDMERSQLIKSENLDNEWINNILKQLSYAYCYNDMENNNVFVYIQKKILNNFLCIELLPLFKKNLENLLLASAQNWLMAYIHQSFYLTLNVQPINIFKKKKKKKEKEKNNKKKNNKEITNYSSEYSLDRYSSNYKKSDDSYKSFSDESVSKIKKNSKKDSKIDSKKNSKKNGKKKYYSDDSYSSSSNDNTNKKKGKIKNKEDENSKKNAIKDTKDKPDLFDSSYSSDHNSYKDDKKIQKKKKDTIQKKEHDDIENKHYLTYDNYSDKSEKSYISNKNDEKKKKKAIINNIKKNHNVYEVMSIICESINFGIRLHIVACDIYGDIIEYIYLDNIYIDIIKKEKTIIEQEQIANDVNILLSFLNKIKPDIICVGIRDIPSYMVFSYIQNMLHNGKSGRSDDRSGRSDDRANFSSKDQHSNGSISHNITSIIIAENLYIPFIVTNNLKYSTDLTTKYSREALLGLSLCRYVQNPLDAVLSLFEDENKNMFNICLHDLQKYICGYKLEHVFYRIILDIVNKTGCDINFVKKKKQHFGNALSYISGLGLRKKEELMKLLHNKNLNTREDLLTLSSNKNLIGNCVYINCASFIRIIATGNEYIEALDNTRIHPLNYHDVILDLFMNSVENKKNNFFKNKNIYDIVNYIIDKKKIINNIEIKEFSKKHYLDRRSKRKSSNNDGDDGNDGNNGGGNNGGGNNGGSNNDGGNNGGGSDILIYPYLKFVKNELLQPYKDYRCQYENKTEEELFYLIINEKKENLTVGSEAVCKMNYINKKNGIIKITILPYNIKGYISDSREFLKQLKNYYIDKMNYINSNAENLNDKNYNNKYNRVKLKDDEYINESIIGEIIKGRIASVKYNLNNTFETNFQIVVTDENKKKIKKQQFLGNLVDVIHSDILSPLTEFDLDYNNNNNFIENHFKKLNDNEGIDAFDEEEDDDEQINDGHKMRIKNKNKYYQNKKYSTNPIFKIWTYHEVHTYLKQPNVSIGESIIYPSNEINKLYIIIKTCDNPFLIAKFTIYEKNIHHNNININKSSQSIQQVFIINNEQYKSFENIVSSFCNNFKKNLLELYNHPKCKRKKSIDQIRKELSHESFQKPDNIVWALIPPIYVTNKNDQKNNINDNNNNIQDINPLRFILMVIPPHHHQTNYSANNKHQNKQADLIVLQDSIYVSHKSFKLWTKIERTFKDLIIWWKEKGYWNRQNERQEYMNEKRIKMEEYKKMRSIQN
ncbi:transcription elongation factor SPT6 [Plasmodium yoelii yoelii]|uniref:Transcription elongation factor SPT6 n=2 Tax=Plasmodium yoelii TaxID=5861 RepID=A0AAE9WXD0_PLAYO|nr:transcription elongation factor SPT6 [Plasmodium yoelii yoelii]